MADTDGNEWVLLDTDLTARLAILPSAMSHLYFVLNEPGSGELKIPLESNAAALIESGQFAQASYRGGARGGFFVDNIQKMQADASEGGGKSLSISGRGGLALLEDAIVWDDGTTASTREFAAMTKADILITLIDEAQARGGLAALTYDFSATNDSDSVAWTDSESYQLSVGTSVLDVLRQFAKTGIDFDIVYSSGSFVLSAYKNGKGTDKSETIYFRTGVNCEEVKSDERGDAIKNALRVAYKAGNVTITDSTSITNRRRREKLLDARVAQTAASATTYGSAILANSKDPRKGISVKIYDGVGPRVFLDYDLGDYIMLDVEGTETSYRVLGIQLDWDGKDYSNVVVELNTLLYENEIRMAQDIDWLLDQWETARDADLLEVSYWAAIGDPSIPFVVTDMKAIGTKLFVMSSVASYYYETTTGAWTTLPTMNSPICTAVIGTDLYIGAIRYVYKYDSTTGTLTTVGETDTTLTTERVVSMSAIGTDLYVTGVFTTIDTVPANKLAKYNTLTDTWTEWYGGGLTGTVLCQLTVGSGIYLGGLFSVVGGTSVTNVALWNGSAFLALAGGLDSNVLTLALYGSNILAGGYFTDAISEWDGAAWTTFGGGVSDNVRGIAVYLTDVYVVGDFTDIGNRISRYSGGTWWELGTGLNASTTHIVLIDNDVYVGGSFTTAGDKPASKVAAYFNNFESLVDYLENASSSFNMGAAIHAATASTISDSDEVPFWEDVANALRKITWANIKATLKTYFDTLYVALTGNQTIAGVKTFSSSPIIPDEAYDATAWNGVLEPPTKNALRDKIETMGFPAGSDTQVQVNDGGVFGGDDEFTYTVGGQIVSLGKNSGTEATHVFSWSAGGLGVSFHNIASWGTGVYSSVRGIMARGTKGTPTAAQADDIGMRYRGSAYDGTGTVLNSATGAEIRFIANENQDATHHGMRAEIWTTPNGSTTETKAFTINADGTVNIASGKTYNINGSPHTHTYAEVGAREKLTANRTYYVRTDGNNSNTGLANTAGGAWLTWQKAIDVVTGNTLDFGGYTVTIQIADGTYTGAAVVSAPWTGGGGLTITGNTTTPANVLLSTTSASAFRVTCVLPGAFITQGFKVQTTTSGFGFSANGIGVWNFGYMDFGACAQIHISNTSMTLKAFTNYTISGGAYNHIYCIGGGSNVEIIGMTLTLTGTPAFTTFADVTTLASLIIYSTSFSGSATGSRYAVALNGVIFTNYGGATFLPGNSAGTSGTGGQYL